MVTRPPSQSNLVEFEPYRLARARRALPLLDAAEDQTEAPRAAISAVRELTDTEVAHRRQMLKHLGPR